MNNESDNRPDIYYDRLAKLTPEERAQLRAIVLSPLWVKFLRVIAGMKPSSFCPNSGSSVARDAFGTERAAARLSEILGWELYEKAIYVGLLETREKPDEVEATYPDSGNLDIEPKLPNPNNKP